MLRNLLVFVISAVFGVAAYGQTVEYLTPGDILRRDITEFFNAKNEFTRSIAEINAEFAAAQEKLAQAEPGTAAHAQAQEHLAKLELGKNLNLLGLYIAHGVTQDSEMVMKIPRFMGGAKLAGGIPDEARADFYRWVRAVRGKLGKADGELLVVTDSEAFMNALRESHDDYDAYVISARKAQANEERRLKDQHYLALHTQNGIERAKLPGGAVALSRSRTVPFLESGIAMMLYQGKARDLVLQEGKRGQMMLQCIYGPIQGAGAVTFEHQYFWYESTAASHDQMAKLDTSGTLAQIPKQPATECPPSNRGSASLQQDDYPSGPIRVVIPARGSSVGQVVFDKASQLLDQAVVVDRSIRHRFAFGREAPSDGYTLFLCSFECATYNLLNKHFLGNITDLVPIMLIGTGTDILVVNPGLKVDTVAELIALSKEKPGSLRMASSGDRSPSHFAGEYFNGQAHIQAQHRPYRDVSTALSIVASGQSDYMLVDATAAMPYLTDNRLKGIAASSPLQAVSGSIPSFAEGGLPGYSATDWTMVLVPTGTSEEHMERLNEAFNSAMDDAEVIERLSEMAVVPMGGTAQDARAFMDAQIAQWKALIDETPVKFK